MPDFQQQKSEMRISARENRAIRFAAGNIGQDLVRTFLQCDGLVEKLASNVSGFMPMKDEVDVMPLLSLASERGATIGMPVTPERGQPLTFRRWSQGDEMDSGPFGIREPKRSAPIVKPDLLLVPLLAFDRNGYRLGYGGGYFDRTILALRREKAVLAVGVAFAVQEVARVPRDDSDARLDWILTENEAIKLETV